MGTQLAVVVLVFTVVVVVVVVVVVLGEGVGRMSETMPGEFNLLVVFH